MADPGTPRGPATADVLIERAKTGQGRQSIKLVVEHYEMKLSELLTPAMVTEFELGQVQRDLLRNKLETEEAISKELGELLEVAEERYQLYQRERAILQRRVRHQRAELAVQSRVNEELRRELTREKKLRRELENELRAGEGKQER